jgi:hypothetical protein
MNLGTSFIPNPQPTILMQPCNSALYDPPIFTQPASMGCLPFGQHWRYATLSEDLAMGLRIIAPIPLHFFRTTTRTPRLAANRWDGIYQGNQLGYVTRVRAGQDGRQGNALRICNEMVFTPRFRAVGWIRTSFLPPRRERIEALSTTARDQSIWSDWRNFGRSRSWISCQTPAACQSRKRRQQVIPEPHPNSCGRYSQGIPVFNTNRMPVKAWRLVIGLRPGKRFRRCLGCGNIGSSVAQRSSSKSGLAMRSPPITLV